MNCHSNCRLKSSSSRSHDEVGVGDQSKLKLLSYLKIICIAKVYPTMSQEEPQSCVFLMPATMMPTTTNNILRGFWRNPLKRDFCSKLTAVCPPKVGRKLLHNPHEFSVRHQLRLRLCTKVDNIDHRTITCHGQIQLEVSHGVSLLEN